MGISMIFPVTIQLHLVSVEQIKSWQPILITNILCTLDFFTTTMTRNYICTILSIAKVYKMVEYFEPKNNIWIPFVEKNVGLEIVWRLELSHKSCLYSVLYSNVI